MDSVDMLSNLLPDGLPRILPPYDDGIFQSVLTLPEARAALASTVATYIERPVKSVALRNNDAPTRDAKAKRERYDINCSVDNGDGDQCNIEMQASPMKGDSSANEHSNVKWRSVYNLSHLHSNQPGRGIQYDRFARSFQIMICNYKVFDFDNDLVERFTYRNEKGYELCEATMSIIVDLTQAKEIAKKPVDEMSDQEAWSVFFALGNDPQYSEVIIGLTKKMEGIAVAYNALLSISQDADERARYHSRRMWEQDREHEQAVAREEGRKEVRTKYEPLLARKDAEIADKDAKLADKDAEIADKDSKLADSYAEIEALRARLGIQEGQ